ncbi:MAG: sugar-binding domain-containing protein [Bacteroidota bacterium]
MKYNLLRTSILLIILMSPIKNLMGQVRKTVNLNKEWKFTLVERDIDYINLTDASWKQVTIPHTWNNKDIQSGKKVHYGTAWYKRTLKIDTLDNKSQYFLKFDGVGQYAELYINNKYIGKHLGSYAAFVFNITEFLHSDKENSILLKVNNELNKSYPKDNFLFGIYGGIYRNVSLIVTNDLHLALTDYASSGVYVQQKNVSKKKAALTIQSLLKNETSKARNITVINRLISKEAKVVSENSVEQIMYPGGIIPIVTNLTIKKPRLWNGKIDPYLYRLETEVLENGKTVDKISQSIGIRFFSIDREKGFMLNGKPYALHGVCRHQEWQDKGNALLPEHHKKDMDLINEIGATTIRLAHYQQSDYIYSLADSMGFLIWAEIPFVNGYKDGASNNAKQQLTELIKQHFNSPSIFVWGVHNEVVKGKVVQKPVSLTKELHTLAKTIDPDRFTVSVSNIWWVYDHPIHENTDLQGFNQYTGWYGGKPSELGKWINNYHTAKPMIRFSVSEYGAGGNIAHQTIDFKNFKPDPVGQFFPETYQTYYHELTYDAIEKSPFIWGSYVWNMFDFSVPEWDRGDIKGRNHKGLITYDRKIKKDAFYWYKANWSEDPVLYLTGRRNNNLDKNDLTFKAYCNIGIPELFINGKSRGKMIKGINSVQFLSNQISLSQGENTVEIRVLYKNKTYKDEYTLKVGDTTSTRKLF